VLLSKRIESLVLGEVFKAAWVVEDIVQFLSGTFAKGEMEVSGFPRFIEFENAILGG
jgi:hypothetical protein